MMPNPEQNPICPYCGALSELVHSDEIYKPQDRDAPNYGYMYVCWPCDARVGCHKGTTNPLGSLANAELRNWRKQVHFLFDSLWEDREERKAAYAWLAQRLGIPFKKCHIGNMSVEVCKQAIEIVKEKRT
jgi:hypothetical protein